MKLLKVIYISFLVATLALTLSCASKPSEEEPPSDLADATSDVASSSATAATGDTSEGDLSSPETGRPAVQAPEPAPAPAVPPPAMEESLDSPPQANANEGAPEPVPAPAAPPPEVAQDNTPAPAPGPEVPAPESAPIDNSGPPAKLTGLDFKANVNGGTVVIRTDKPVQFSTRKNSQTNQLVVELPNTRIPKNFRRPYDTKEFSGPIGSINAYQSQGNGRIVIQLREAVEPGVSQNGNVISVAGQGGAPPANVAEQTDKAAAQNAEVADTGSENSDETINETSTALKEDSALQKSSVDDFAFGSNSKFYGRPISLELKDADIRDVFAFISEESGLNIVIGDDVNGRVTLKLRKIPWDQALMVLLQSKSLGYVRQGKILRISTLATLQRESDSARGVLDAQRLLEPLHVQVFPISYAIVGDIEAQTKDFLSPRGKARSDKRTNNLVVTDIDENLVRIKALVKRLDTQTPQVIIEAKVIEARESYQRMMGVNWAFTGNQTDTGLSNSQGQAINITPNASTQAPAQGFLNAGFSLGQLDVFGNLTASLNLLEIEGLAKVLSAPRIVTLDRQEADISQTSNIPYITTTLAATAVPGSAPVASNQVGFVSVKLELKVKPQITVDGSVIMDLDVLRQFADPVIVPGSPPQVNSREAKTQVLVENGDTIVIGGIYQVDTTDTTSGVPWLMNIPVLGWLFKNKSVNRDKNELVIFLTPRILNREKAFDKSVEIGPEISSSMGAPGTNGTKSDSDKGATKPGGAPAQAPPAAPAPPSPNSPGGAG